MMTDVFLMILALNLAELSGIAGQKFDFPNGISYNETCSLSPHTDWSAQGSVELTAGDFIGFQPKVIIRAFHDLCVVDLTACPPDHPPTTRQPCFCQSRQDDRYTINIGSRLDSGRYGGMTVQAVVPGRGALKEIYGAIEIGTLPNKTDNLSRVSVTYKMDDGEPRDLKFSQNVTVCGQKRIPLDICIQNGRPGADLQITVDGTTTTNKRTCIASLVTSGGSKTITFVYNDHVGCRQLHRIFLNEAAEVCSSPTPSVITPTSTATPVATTSTVKTTESTPSTTDIEGVCPPSPRTLTTLPSGLQTLTDDVSFNKSWTIFQRRISGDVDFYRPWVEYVAGFGNVSGDYWLGLKTIHHMCNNASKCELLVHLEYTGNPQEVTQQADGCYHGRYPVFWLGGPDQNYTLNVDGFSGTSGDSLKVLKNPGGNLDKMQFSTFNRDNDKSPTGSCAINYKGGWWYNNCHLANLNGIFGLVDDWKAAMWYTLTGKNSVRFSEMKMAHQT